MAAHSRIAFLRHCLATLAYRGGKAVAGAPRRMAGAPIKGENYFKADIKVDD